MERYQNRQFDRTAYPTALDSLDGPANVRRAIPSEDTRSVTAIDLVNQAAQVIQSIEDQAAETKMRALWSRRKAQRRPVSTRRMLVLTTRSKRPEPLNRRLLTSKIGYALLKTVPEMPKHAQSRQKRLSFGSKKRSGVSCLRNGNH